MNDEPFIVPCSSFIVSSLARRKGLLLNSSYVSNEIQNPIRVSPLVVVPRQDLVHVRIHGTREGGIDDRRVRVAVEVARYELFIGVAEDVAQIAFGCIAEDLIDLVHVRRFLGGKGQI